MGPRSLDRGNHRTVEVQRGGQVLQWGRDLSIAEMAPLVATAVAKPSLQWGRDLSIAEINIPKKYYDLMAQLQWGRDLSIAEINTALLGADEVKLCFNGAAISRSRK